MSSSVLIILTLCLVGGLYGFKAWCSLSGFYIRKTRDSPYRRKRTLPVSVEVARAKLMAWPILDAHSVENYKRLYYKLQHVDDYPGVLQAAERLLQSLLSHTDRLASRDGTSSSILSLEEYSEPKLSEYMLKMEMSVQDEYSRYCGNRKAGFARELFETTGEAADWLRDISPVKLVDGAWLGNLRLANASFALQPILRTAWQVLSEELGDGVLARNHVHVFENLVRSVIPDFPDADSLEFLDCFPDQGNTRTWRSALAQLTISLFPDRYLPEILGFNMNFELVTLETLKASTELKEIGLDPLYFLLHICIDNSDVGHTAMAIDTAMRYIEHMRDTEGDVAAEEAWRRVQRGFVLSQYVGQIEDDHLRYMDDPSPATHTSLESQVIEIFKKKTQPARSVHCVSPVRLQGLSIEEWLAPDRWENPEWRTHFIDALCSSKPWIVKGDRSRSRLMRELNWGGKMFGAFTTEEYTVVGQWIDEMKPDGCPDNTLSMVGVADTPLMVESFCGKTPIPDRFFSLWFSSMSLLEGFCAVPAQTTSHFSMHILSALRSQSGLGQTGYGTAGAEEVPKGAWLSLSTIGQEMVHNAGLPLPKSVYDMLELWPVNFGSTMMNLAQSFRRNGDYLVGMALAFADLHEAMAASELLCTASQTALLAMARSELFHLGQCKALLESSEKRKQRFDHGYRLARWEIEKAFIVPEYTVGTPC